MIALSQSAFVIQKQQILKVGLSDKERKRLLNKLFLLHPPQKTLISAEEIREKFFSIHNQPVKFVFVGHDFFLKGGWEMLQALDELKDKFCFQLTLISKLNRWDYASAITEEEYNACIKMIHNSCWIDYYQSLPNEDVLRILKKAHVGILVSLADTYGYSVLEMQASGCPCLTSNIRALGEINNSERGWICDISLNKYGEVIYGCYSAKTRQKIRQETKKKLIDCFIDILSHHEQLHQKAIAAVDYITNNHDPEKYAERLRKIYEQGLN